MNGVLIVAHGSRRQETASTLEHMVELVKKQIGGVEIASAFMEFNHPNVTKGLDELKEKGCKNISVVPYFLFDGIHIHEDIPGELEAFRAENPQIEVTMGQTLGKDPRLADVLAERVRAAVQ